MVAGLRFLAFFALLAFSAVAGAQMNTKAYAPEDLRRLTVQDRIRVIEKEYAEQSRGRAIPDDQLEFYLDQIDSGWSFSRIKEDISESLGGGAWRPSTPNWQASELICSSIDREYAECRTPFRGPAVLSEQLSDAACIEGQSWGQRRGVLWVDRGCRGRFREGRWGGTPGFDSRGGVVCESREGKLRRCQLPFRGPVRLTEQLSNADCIEGRTWGQSPGEVWVSRGCRAVFEEVRGGPGYGHRPGHGSGWDDGYGGYSVTCSSVDDRYTTCAWNERQGRPEIIEQLSRTSCIEGRTWGWKKNQIWVDNGCRARFGARRR